MKHVISIRTLLTLILAFIPRFALALDAEVLVRGLEGVTSATGLIITAQGTEKRTPVSFEQIGANTVAVRLQYSEQDIRNGALVSAIATNAKGETAFATVSELRSQETKPASLHLSRCEATPTKTPANTQQLVLFERLVELRKQRREVKMQELQEALTEELAAKLSKLEAHFGYEYESPLSAQMNPVVLSQRLDQLLHSIETFNLHRNSQ
ncbi:MAG: hypothetical protein KDD55_09385 [Bdellovibrionales bacterium]|nr:hypothetical protein [Bdellovibrionales bacterium]